MPFTLSHSAAVLPLLKSKRLSATGLIIGTMAPDFEYFIRMNIQGIYGHTLSGIFYFDIPVSIVAAFLFHSVAKKNLIDQLPVFLQAKLKELRDFDFTEYIKTHKAIFILSVILGTVTHIVWDGFTHQRQFFVTHLPEIYEGRVIPFLGVRYPLWYALQYMSTVIGGILVVVYVLMMKSEAGVYNRPRIIYWIILLVLIAAITELRMQFFNEGSQAYVARVITICSAFCITITILGLVPFRKVNG